jgi:hypothetical protein
MQRSKTKIPKSAMDVNYNSATNVDRISSPASPNSITYCYYDPLSTKESVSSPVDSVGTPGADPVQRPLLYRLPSYKK